MHALELVELVFELLQPVAGQDDFFVVQTPTPGTTRGRAKRTADVKLDRVHS
jgi:hypothetical protein